MKATRAAFYYGTSRYPVEDSNLPEAEDLELMADVVRQEMSRLSGGFNLPLDYFTFTVGGDGWMVEFSHNVEGEIQMHILDGIAEDVQ